MYSSITQDIQVTVEPEFVPERSDAEQATFFWAYTVEIANQGDQTVQLTARHWRIMDGNGRTEEVLGTGVVGEQPVLKPGESFRYTSGCPLSTPSGIMTGSYRMVAENGEVFDAEIPVFSLDSPYVARVSELTQLSPAACAARADAFPSIIGAIVSDRRIDSTDRLAATLDMLARLVAFDTESVKSNLPLIADVESYLQAHGVDFVKVPNAAGDKAALFATIGPNIDGGIILSGHTDCVPVAGQTWTSDPFTLRREGSRVYARGACDMKGFDALCLAMVPEFPARRSQAAHSHPAQL